MPSSRIHRKQTGPRGSFVPALTLIERVPGGCRDDGVISATGEVVTWAHKEPLSGTQGWSYVAKGEVVAGSQVAGKPADCAAQGFAMNCCSPQGLSGMVEEIGK